MAETAAARADYLVGDAGIELMAIAAWRLRIRRSSLANIKVSYGQIASANYVSTFVHKPQISLAFCLSKSNGRVRAQGRSDARRIDPPTS